MPESPAKKRKMGHYKKRILLQHENHKAVIESPLSSPRSESSHSSTASNRVEKNASDDGRRGIVKRKWKRCRGQFRHENLPLYKLGSNGATTSPSKPGDISKFTQTSRLPVHIPKTALTTDLISKIILYKNMNEEIKHPDYQSSQIRDNTSESPDQNNRNGEGNVIKQHKKVMNTIKETDSNKNCDMVENTETHDKTNTSNSSQEPKPIECRHNLPPVISEITERRKSRGSLHIPENVSAQLKINPAEAVTNSVTTNHLGINTRPQLIMTRRQAICEENSISNAPTNDTTSAMPSVNQQNFVRRTPVGNNTYFYEPLVKTPSDNNSIINRNSTITSQEISKPYPQLCSLNGNENLETFLFTPNVAQNDCELNKEIMSKAKINPSAALNLTKKQVQGELPRKHHNLGNPNITSNRFIAPGPVPNYTNNIIDLERNEMPGYVSQMQNLGVHPPPKNNIDPRRFDFPNIENQIQRHNDLEVTYQVQSKQRQQQKRGMTHQSKNAGDQQQPNNKQMSKGGTVDFQSDLHLISMMRHLRSLLTDTTSYDKFCMISYFFNSIHSIVFKGNVSPKNTCAAHMLLSETTVYLMNRCAKLELVHKNGFFKNINVLECLLQNNFPPCHLPGSPSLVDMNCPNNSASLNMNILNNPLNESFSQMNPDIGRNAYNTINIPRNNCKQGQRQMNIFENVASQSIATSPDSTTPTIHYFANTRAHIPANLDINNNINIITAAKNHTCDPITSTNNNFKPTLHRHFEPVNQLRPTVPLRNDLRLPSMEALIAHNVNIAPQYEPLPPTAEYCALRCVPPNVEKPNENLNTNKNFLPNVMETSSVLNKQPNSHVNYKNARNNRHEPIRVYEYITDTEEEYDNVNQNNAINKANERVMERAVSVIVTDHTESNIEKSQNCSTLTKTITKTASVQEESVNANIEINTNDEQSQDSSTLTKTITKTTSVQKESINANIEINTSNEKSQDSSTLTKSITKTTSVQKEFVNANIETTTNDQNSQDSSTFTKKITQTTSVQKESVNANIETTTNDENSQDSSTLTKTITKTTSVQKESVNANIETTANDEISQDSSTLTKTITKTTSVQKESINANIETTINDENSQDSSTLTKAITKTTSVQKESINANIETTTNDENSQDSSTLTKAITKTTSVQKEPNIADTNTNERLVIECENLERDGDSLLAKRITERLRPDINPNEKLEALKDVLKKKLRDQYQTVITMLKRDEIVIKKEVIEIEDDEADINEDIINEKESSSDSVAENCGEGSYTRKRKSNENICDVPEKIVPNHSVTNPLSAAHGPSMTNPEIINLTQEENSQPTEDCENQDKISVLNDDDIQIINEPTRYSEIQDKNCNAVDEDVQIINEPPQTLVDNNIRYKTPEMIRSTSVRSLRPLITSRQRRSMPNTTPPSRTVSSPIHIDRSPGPTLRIENKCPGDVRITFPPQFSAYNNNCSTSMSIKMNSEIYNETEKSSIEFQIRNSPKVSVPVIDQFPSRYSLSPLNITENCETTFRSKPQKQLFQSDNKNHYRNMRITKSGRMKVFSCNRLADTNDDIVMSGMAYNPRTQEFGQVSNYKKDVLSRQQIVSLFNRNNCSTFYPADGRTYSSDTASTSSVHLREESGSNSNTAKDDSDPRVDLNVPQGKLMFYRRKHVLLRYFEDTQAALYIRNINVDSTNPHADDEIINNKKVYETIRLPSHIYFSSNESLTDPDEYIAELDKAETYVPTDFYLFYNFVTRYQIVRRHNPISFLTFLTMYNTNGLKDLLKRYVASLKADVDKEKMLNNEGS